MRPTTEKLLITSLYFACAMLSLITFGITGSQFNLVDLVLTIIGISTLSAAATQGLVRKVIARKNDKPLLPMHTATASTPSTPRIKNSTHAIVNSALHIISSSCFLASDLRYVAQPTMPLIARSIGSALWLKSALLYLGEGITYERHVENRINPEVPYRFNPNAVYLVGEIEYLVSAVCYALAIYNSPTISPYRALGNALWLTAGMHDTWRAILAMRHNQIGISPSLENSNPLTMMPFHGLENRLFHKEMADNQPAEVVSPPLLLNAR